MVGSQVKSSRYQPLATRMRPQILEEFVGQKHLLTPGKPLRDAIEKGVLHSMILWGPPGTGKTTLAELMAHYAHAHFKRLSAISSGVKEIRELVSEAEILFREQNKPLILFMDEIHRFNKAQQDIFLPLIEHGTFILVGATTENPSFELNNALLSRMRIYVLKSLTKNELMLILERSLMDKTRGLGNLAIDFPEDLRELLVQSADGDSRQLLNVLEIIGDLSPTDKPLKITKNLLTEVLQTNLRRFDKQGDMFYDQISALHKSIRGSVPDAALYWFCRMIDAGCDPRYIARRLIRMAIEDIGLADPRALDMALQAAQVYERLGTPEGELALAEVVIYLCCAAKSNAAYVAYNEAMKDAKTFGSLPVPLHIRNAPTSLMKNLGHGKNYRYAHDEPGAYAAHETYIPSELPKKQYYRPTSRGLEEKIAAKLNYLKGLDKK